jgi:sugar O-acyltransferase (sialic acid O-acetyltransferase NeuD family)
MKSKLFLCGAGNAEGVRLALRVNEKESRWKEILILDDDPSKKGKRILNVEIVGSFDLLKEADPENCEVANLVARTTKKRYAALQKINEFNIPFATLIDPNVDIWGVEYKNDITVYQNVTFSAGAFVDEESVVFTGAVIGHGCKVGKGCVIAPGAVLNARVELGDGVYVGTNASILPDLMIGAWATIGINSGIVQDIPDGATAMGVPADILLAAKANLNNKILPKAAAGKPKTKTIFKAPTSDIEISLAEIWSGILKIEKIGVDDDFFDLGGHSLSAVQIAFQIQKKLNVNIPLQSFFDSPTISELSKKIESELVGNTSGANLEKLLDEIEGISR